MYKLMIVEDEEIIRQGLVESLDWESVRLEVVAAAPNGKRALAMLETQPVDVILTDIRMPIMDGIALMGAVSERYPDIKVVVLSGYRDFAYAQHAMRCGARGYILKPATDDEVFGAVRKVVDLLDREKEQAAAAGGTAVYAPGGRAAPFKAEEDPTIQRVKAYIETNYNKKITLDQISQVAYMNPTYFCTFFKNKTGCSFKDYHIRVRIEKAKELLSSTDMTVLNIAATVGYDDYRYFSKIFKAATGTNISLYRREARGS